MEEQTRTKKSLREIGKEAFEILDKYEHDKQYQRMTGKLVNAAESGDVEYLRGVMRKIPPRYFLPVSYQPVFDSLEAARKYGGFVVRDLKAGKPTQKPAAPLEGTEIPTSDQKHKVADRIQIPGSDEKHKVDERAQIPGPDQKQEEESEADSEISDQEKTQKPDLGLRDKVERLPIPASPKPTVEGIREMAEIGDVSKLRKALGAQVPAGHFLPMTDIPFERNIIHKAVFSGHKEFIKVALEELPAKISLLLCVKDPTSLNPLHIAALLGDAEIIELLVSRYKLRLEEARSSHEVDRLPRCPPWLAKDPEFERTPLLTALIKKQERAAMSLLMLDMELVCNMTDKFGYSPLYAAVEAGYSHLSTTILNSRYACSLNGPEGSTPLHVVPNCCENVCSLLLEKHPNLIDVVDRRGFTVLHQWAEIGKVWALQWLINSEFSSARSTAFKTLICFKDSASQHTPLQIAARNGNTEVVKWLIAGFLQETKGQASTSSVPCIPWQVEDKDGNRPLHTALNHRHEESALYLLSLDIRLFDTRNNEGESPLFIAVKNGCEKVVKQILGQPNLNFSLLRRNDGQTILHILSKCSEEVCELVTQSFWWLIFLTDISGRTAIDEAKEAGEQWLIDKLTTLHSTQRANFNWSEICRSGDLSVVRTFIEHCQDFKKICLEQRDTPLHHIKLRAYKDYQDFLAIPLIAELKNARDSEGATPLHLALQRQDILLAELLLKDSKVDRSIKDNKRRRPMDLLRELCKEHPEWEEMCTRNGINPRIRTTYIQSQTNLADMRGTLSVVAALLATITFAAGFTLPGGFDNQKGDAVLAKNAAFLVFLLADTYAMCCSMLVLFCLIWSMVCDPSKSLLLIDRSVVILMQSLYGSLLAFMTGIYTVVSHKSLWAAILVLFMCALIGVSTNKTILYKILDKFIPAANEEQKDRFKYLEEGRASSSHKVD